MVACLQSTVVHGAFAVEHLGATRGLCVDQHFLPLVAFSTRAVFFGGASFWSSSASSCLIFISASVPTATVLQRCDSKPLILQNVSVQSQLWLVRWFSCKIQLTCLFSSSGQHTTQVVIGFYFLGAFFTPGFFCGGGSSGSVASPVWFRVFTVLTCFQLSDLFNLLFCIAHPSPVLPNASMHKSKGWHNCGILWYLLNNTLYEILCM